MNKWREDATICDWVAWHAEMSSPDALDAQSVQLMYVRTTKQEEFAVLKIRPWPDSVRMWRPVLQLLNREIQAQGGRALPDADPPAQRLEELRRWASKRAWWAPAGP